MKASAIGASTMSRLAAMQTWPDVAKREAIAASTALSRSASASTMKASEPPSSSTDFLRYLPANAATAAPARGLPVKVTPVMRSSAMMPSIGALSTLRMPNRPFGAPARSKAAPSIVASPMQFGACFRRKALPPSVIGTPARSACHSG